MSTHTVRHSLISGSCPAVLFPFGLSNIFYRYNLAIIVIGVFIKAISHICAIVYIIQYILMFFKYFQLINCKNIHYSPSSALLLYVHTRYNLFAHSSCTSLFILLFINVSGYVCNHGSPSGERDTASPRGRYGERRQRDSCLKIHM